MKDYNEMVICESCRAVISLSYGIGMIPVCPECGSASIGVIFLRNDGSLIIWDEKSEKIFSKNKILHWLEGVMRRFLAHEE
jgi:hypothetical protein